MDPEITWGSILYCLDNNQPEDALQMVEDLQEWSRKGGFLPDYITPSLLEKLRAGLIWERDVESLKAAILKVESRRRRLRDNV